MYPLFSEYRIIVRGYILYKIIINELNFLVRDVLLVTTLAIIRLLINNIGLPKSYFSSGLFTMEWFRQQVNV